MKNALTVILLALTMTIGLGNGPSLADMMPGGRHMMDDDDYWQGRYPHMQRGFMMGPGMGMGMGGMYGPGMGMMGGCMMGYGQGRYNLAEMEKFRAATKVTRKKLHDMMFDYGEAMWDPKTTVGELQKMQERINELQQEITTKLPQE